MAELVDDGDGRTVSLECVYFCAPGSPAWCESPHCRCVCHDQHHLPPHAARALLADIEQEMARDPRPGVGGFGPRTAAWAGGGGTDVERARALDDRDQAALANVARDVEAESKPDYRTVYRERFGRDGWPRRGAA